MRLSIALKGGKELEQTLKKMSAENKSKIKGEVYASGIDVQKKAKENLRDQKAWDTGFLANTIIVDRLADGMAVQIGPTAPYGVYVEHGARPHFPPPDALEGWARRHGFDSAWPICKAINERGLPARPFMFPAFLAVKDKFFKKLTEILKK